MSGSLETYTYVFVKLLLYYTNTYIQMIHVAKTDLIQKCIQIIF